MHFLQAGAATRGRATEQSDYDELIFEMAKIGDVVMENPLVKPLLHYMQLCGVSFYTGNLLREEYSKDSYTWDVSIGLLLMLVGYLGWISARIALGNLFAVQPKALGLVKTGIYSKIRNPIYLFGTIYFIGFGIYVRLSWYFLVAGIGAVIYAQHFRSAAEAKVLREHYGNEYELYEKDVWI